MGTAQEIFGESRRLFSAAVSSVCGQHADLGFSSTRHVGEVDAGIYAVFVAGFLALILVLKCAILPAIANALLRNPQPSTRHKFCDSAVEFVLYALFTLMGFRIVLTQNWIWPSSSWFDAAGGGYSYSMRDDLRCYYILDAARYTATLIQLVCFDHRRKDFMNMLVHHVATIICTVFSYGIGQYRIGAIVKLIMDPADVPLHFAKLSKYVGEARGSWLGQYIADRFFECFAVTFFVSRLVFYSYVVVYAASYESVKGGVDLDRFTPGWWCVLCLYVLLALQIYWFGLIVKVATNMSKGHGAADVRSSDDEDDDEDEVAAAKKSRKLR